MPFIVYGTRFLSKNSLITRQGVCPFCKNSAALQTYNGFKWFTLYWIIPVIPLGKKQVINECLRCNRYLEMPYQQWIENYQQDRASLKDIFEQDPENLDSAVKYLSFVSMNEGNKEAFQVAGTIRQRFKDRADVMTYLIGWYSDAGFYSSSFELIDQLIPLITMDDAVRRLFGAVYSAGGEPEKAKKYYLELDDAAIEHDFMPMMRLVEAFIRLNRYSDAYDILIFLHNRFQRKAVKRYYFKSTLKRVEKKLQVPSGILPKESLFSPGRILIAGLIAGIPLLIGGLIFWLNSVLIANQPFYLISHIEKNVTVEIDGSIVKNLQKNSLEKMSISEGVHQLKITDEKGTVAEKEIKIKNTLIQRLFTGSNAFVYNINGASVLLYQVIPYAVDAEKYEHKYEVKVHAGTDFYVFRMIDYLFTDAPESVTLDKYENYKLKRSLSVYEDHPIEIVKNLRDYLTEDQIMSMIEGRLAGSNEYEELLLFYQFLGEEFKMPDRCREFINQLNKSGKSI